MSRILSNITQGNKFKDEVESLNLLKTGLHSFSITNFDNNQEPQIEGGSFLELNGTIYEWKNTISIEGTKENGLVFLRTDVTIIDNAEKVSIVYDSDLVSTNVSWDYGRKGHYDENKNRIVCSFIYDDGDGSYTEKKYLLDRT